MRFKSVLKGSWYYSVKVSQRVCHWHRLIKAEEMRATGLLWEIKTSITCVLFLQFCESISEILSKFHKTFKKRTNKVGSTHLEWLSRNRSQSCVVVFRSWGIESCILWKSTKYHRHTKRLVFFVKMQFSLQNTKNHKCHSLVFSYSFVGNFAKYVSYTIYTTMTPFLRFSIYTSVLTIYLRYITIVRFSLHNCAEKFSSIMISKCNIITNV